MDIDFESEEYENFSDFLSDYLWKKLKADWDPDYSENLYVEYIKTGNQSKMKKWIQEKASEDYQYIKVLPKWPEGEPEWPLYNKKPMIFVNQYKIEEGELSDLTVYSWLYRDEKGLWKAHGTYISYP